MKRTLAAALVNGLLAGMAALTLFPLLWMLAVSLMPSGEASTFPPALLPKAPTLSNYRELFAHAGIGRYLLNSLFLATTVTLVSLLFNVAAGYGFAKLRFRGRDRLFKLLLPSRRRRRFYRGKPPPRRPVRIGTRSCAQPLHRQRKRASPNRTSV